MHARGSLTLYGERIAIDGYFMRDRSWGAERHETPRDLPPITWMTGIVDASWSFHLVAFDDPALAPEWLGRYSSPKVGENLMWGYLHDSRGTSSIRAARKRTLREADGVTPKGFELEIEDQHGQVLPLQGNHYRAHALGDLAEHCRLLLADALGSSMAGWRGATARTSTTTASFTNSRGGGKP